MIHPPRNRRWSRRGFTVMELLVSSAILGVVMVSIGQLAALLVAHERRGEAQREAAQAAHNFVESLAAEPVERLSPENLAALTSKGLDSPVELEVQVESIDDGRFHVKRITVTARHRQMPAVQCQLSAWRHAPREEEP